MISGFLKKALKSSVISKSNKRDIFQEVKRKNISDDLFDISFLYNYWTSSEDEISKTLVGQPIDGYLENDRESIITLNEEQPFLILNSNYNIELAYININFSKTYSLELAITVSYSENGVVWENVVYENVDDKTLFIADFPNKLSGLKLRYIKIMSNGYDKLAISSVNCYAKRSDFLMNYQDRIESIKMNMDFKFVFNYSPFYGLGGRLSTLASALGYVGSSDIKDICFDWGENSELIDYPLHITKLNNYKEIVKNGVSEAASSVILNFKRRKKTEENLSLKIPPSLSNIQKKPIITISRPNMENFLNKNESDFQCFQRLFKRIVPSKKVLEEIKKLEKKYKITSYEHTLGIHIRHGNGEKYYSARRNMWGVKPPSKKNVLKAITEAIYKTSNKIENIIVASDCKVFGKIIKDNYKDINVTFISENIQDIGAGNNHKDSFKFHNYIESVYIEENEIFSFAEILVLSKCANLCGGSSYFFESAIGFSNSKQITMIENTDRYIRLSDDMKPICESEYNHYVELFIENSIYLDGIFMNANSEESIYYFDIEVFKGDFKELKQEIASRKFQQSIEELRMY